MGLEFEDEQHLQNYIAKVMRDQGWNVKTEAKPKETKNWKHSYRVDILASRKVNQKYYKIGLELKHLKKNIKGAKIGEAVRQITDQYRGKNYKCPTTGKYEPFWMFAYLPYYSQKDIADELKANNRFIANFIQKWGVGHGYLKENCCTVKFRSDANAVTLFNRYSKEDQTNKEYTRKRLADCNYKKSKKMVKRRIEGDFR